ncbi:MAG: NADH-quinone oxidoreductase subunit J family protein [Syntrophales bacterium]
MSIGDLLFIGIIGVTLAGALAAVLAGSIVYALMGLVVTMFGVAGLYVYLHSPFLAMVQILIYVGAITVLIAFAIMLIGPQYRRPKEWTTLGKLGAAAGVAVVTLGLFVKFVMEVFPRAKAPDFTVTTKQIGALFFKDLVLPFELISLLIVVAILGAIMLALFARGDK